MRTLGQTWKNVFGEMTKFEKRWLGVFTLVILATTIYFSATGTNWGDWKNIVLNWIVSPVSAVTGVVCVLLVARGSIYNYSFGLVQSILYGLIAWVSGYYGDWILNWFFFVPTQILIYIFWRKHIESKSLDLIRVAKLNWWKTTLAVVFSIGALIGFGFALNSLDHWFIKDMQRNVSIYSNIAKVTGVPLFGPMMDSSTEVLQIAGQILMIARFALQWPMWIATNVITIFMWATVALTDPSQMPMVMPTLIMWVVFLLNSIYGAYNWSKKRRM
jgi:nicotinamide mononucleotide transporter